MTEAKKTKTEKEVKKVKKNTNSAPKATGKKAGDKAKKAGKPSNVSKRVFAFRQKVENKPYSVEKAIDLLKEVSKTKFKETLEVIFNLNVDTAKSDQQIRASINLPAGTGKKITLVAFVPEEKRDLAKKAGADLIADEAVFEEIKKGIINFDKTFATPSFMPKLGQLAKILGPKGLMPNPKLGSVSENIEESIKTIKAGQVEVRADKQGIVHVGFGKIDFETKKLVDNFEKIYNYISSNRPKDVKGKFIKSVYISSTMGPALLIEERKAEKQVA